MLEPCLPQVGEDRSAKADIFQSTLDACTKLMADEAAERLMLGNADLAADDRRQARSAGSHDRDRARQS